MENIISIRDQTARIKKGNVDEGTFHFFDNFCIDSHPREVQVFLPPGYNNKESRYPVVYMNDGQTAFEPRGLSAWCWEVDKTLNRLYKENSITKVIVVAVSPINRADEYLTVKQILDYDDNVINVKGDLPKYANYLANKLKPFIDSNYHTDSDSQKTTIVGSSYAGIASLYITSFHPCAFGNAGAMSPSFFFGTEIQIINQPIEDTDYIKEISASLSSNTTKPRLWIDWGKNEGDLGKYSLKIIKLLKEKLHYTEGKDLFYMEDKIGTHDERAWKYRFELLMKQFYGIL